MTPWRYAWRGGGPAGVRSPLAIIEHLFDNVGMSGDRAVRRSWLLPDLALPVEQEVRSGQYGCASAWCSEVFPDPVALRDHIADSHYLRGDQLVNNLESSGVPVRVIDWPIIARERSGDVTHALVGRIAVDAGSPLCGEPNSTVYALLDSFGATVPVGRHGVGSLRRPTCTRCARRL